MGFLDHSTKNIIVDVVLTDIGRELLARQDGSFQIAKVAFGDDEIDYGIIKKYGIEVGKEKVEKNTPVVEASTLGNLALKYHLFSIPRQDLLYLPSLKMGDSLTNASQGGLSNSNNGTIITMGTGNTYQKTQKINISQSSQVGQSIDVDLIDTSFMVEMNDKFLYLLDHEPNPTKSTMKSYLVLASARSTSGAQVEFTLGLRSLSNEDYKAYGGSTQTIIKTYVRVTGVVSGLVKEFEVQIVKS